MLMQYFGVSDKQRALWYVVVFSGVVNCENDPKRSLTFFFFPEILIKMFGNSFPSCLEIQKNCNVCNFFRGIVLEKTV